MINEEPSYFNLGISSDQDATMRNYFSNFQEELIVSVMDAFIINRPKTGKVGGDGYWVYQSGDNLFLNLFDCKGHGHLASMMTRVYAQQLEKIIIEDEVDDPGTILRYLHHRIFTKFHGNTNLKVGPAASVGVVKINLSVRKIEFSGANLELIVTTNGCPEVIKPFPVLVGVHQEDEHDYKTSLINLSSNKVSNFYLATDGLKKLAGGDDGIKVGKKKLLKMLELVYAQPMINQKAKFIQYISDWQYNFEQEDDLLLVAFAI